MDELEDAWGRLHEAIPARWTVGLPSFDPGQRCWSVSAVGADRGRGRVPSHVSGTGQDELEAIRDLDARLRGERSDGPRRMDELRARLRLAYLAGAEEWSETERGRRLSTAEVRGVVAQFRAR